MTITIDELQADEAEAVGAMLMQALHFGMPADQLRPWMEKRGLDTFRVAKLDGQLAAALNIIDMAQWFGGVAHPTAGISAVGVAPEFRGRTIGAALMDAMLREMRERGVFLSTLYPATTQFYRTLGYERAGSRTIYELVPATITVRQPADHALVAAPHAEPADFDALHTQFASTQAGMLQRPTLMWNRIFQPSNGTPFRYLVRDGDGQNVGYIVYLQGGQFEDMRVLDWCAITPHAVRALLAFVGGHRTMVSKVLWPGAPNDAALYHLTEQGIKVNWALDWMLRLIDVPQALAVRPYPPELRATVHFDLTDERFEWNHGRFVLHVANGVGTIERGGTGNISLHVRDLAALYSGHFTPAELRIAGSLLGPAADLATLALVFSGPRPWMPDMF